MRVMRTKR